MADLKRALSEGFLILNSLEETIVLAQELSLSSLDYSRIVFLLDGDLGVGKTTFVKSFLESLSIEEPITSPSYSIMNHYKTLSKDYYHMDLYRLSSEWDFEELGAEEILSSKESFCFLIEWASLFPSLWQGYKDITFIQLNFSLEGETKRKVGISLL